MPERFLREIEAEAKARRITKSQLIRESLEQTLHKRPQRRFVSCYDLTRDLAGSMTGLPEDLATNPKYMEGLGD
jgi:hypothetical protein